MAEPAQPKTKPKPLKGRAEASEQRAKGRSPFNKGTEFNKGDLERALAAVISKLYPISLVSHL